MTSVTQLKRSSPEAEGIPSSAVLDFIRAVEQHDHPLDAVHGFMLLRHGKVAAEVRVCYYEAVFCPVFRFRCTSGELQLEVEPNVSWDQTTVTTIIGRIAAGIAPQGSASPQFSGPGAERFDE